MKRYFGIVDNKDGYVASTAHYFTSFTSIAIALIVSMIGVQGARKVLSNDGSFVSAITEFYAKYPRISDIVMLAVSLAVAVSLVAEIVKFVYSFVDSTRTEVFEDIK